MVEINRPYLSVEGKPAPANAGGDLSVIGEGQGNTPGPSLFDRAMPGVVTANAEQLFAMARKSSLWTLTFGLALLRDRDDFDLYGPP